MTTTSHKPTSFEAFPKGSIMNAATTVTTKTLAAIERDSARASGWTLARHIDEVREATTSENAEVADYATALLIKLEYLVMETSVPPASSIRTNRR